METLNFTWADENLKIGLLKLNRPKALNALNNQLLSELESLHWKTYILSELESLTSVTN